MSSIGEDPLERVRLTIAGLADAAGRIERWSATDAYAAAGMSRDEFERSLAILEHGRELTVDKTKSRRRFELGPQLRARKADGERFIAQMRRGAPARAVLIENLSRIEGSDRRIRFDVTIEGVGTILDCVFVMGERPFVAGPSRREGAQFKTLVKLDKALSQEIRLTIERRLAADPQLLLSQLPQTSRPSG